MLIFLYNTRVNYNSYTKTLEINIMPNKVHECFLAWLHQEIVDMVVDGFLTRAESKTLRLLGSPSKYYYILLNFLAELEQGFLVCLKLHIHHQ